MTSRPTASAPRLAATLGYLAGSYRASTRGLEETTEDVFDVPIALGTVANLRTELSDAFGPRPLARRAGGTSQRPRGPVSTRGQVIGYPASQAGRTEDLGQGACPLPVFGSEQRQRPCLVPSSL